MKLVMYVELFSNVLNISRRLICFYTFEINIFYNFENKKKNKNIEQ